MTKARYIKTRHKIKSVIFIFIIFISCILLSSCTTAPQSLKIIETIKQDIKQTADTAENINREYKQLIAEKPECSRKDNNNNDIIVSNIEALKSDISNISNKIAIAEYVIETETKAYIKEIKNLKSINLIIIIVLKGLLFLLVYLVFKKTK